MTQEEDEEASGPWAVCEGQIDGKPMIMRINKGIEEAIPRFKTCALFEVAYPAHEHDSLMPDEHSIDQIGEIEDEISSSLSKSGEGILAATTCGNGEYVFIYYVINAAAADSVFKKLKRRRKDLQTTLNTNMDPDWLEYWSLRDGIQDPSEQSRIEPFWSWFLEQEERIFGMDGPTDPVFLELADKVREINPSIFIEIGMADHEQKELSISADGNARFFPLVKAIVKKAPRLRHWKIVAFRQRVPEDVFAETAIETQTKEKWQLFKKSRKTRLSVEDMKFTIKKSPNGVALTLFIKDYNGSENQQGMAVMLLEQGIGEHDLVEKVEHADFADLKSAAGKTALPFKTIARELDKLIPPDDASSDHD